MSSTSQAPPLPAHMQRVGFAPPSELAALRDAPEGGGMRRVTTALGGTAWLVTRYADVREVLGDAERFSNESMPPFPVPGDGPDSEDDRRAGSLLMVDPPEHTRLRKLLTGEFTVRRIRRLEPRITEIVEDHLDAMAAAGPPADLVGVFALPVPSLVICELLGVPYADRTEFQERASRQLDVSRSFQERGRVAMESRAYMGELVDRARTEPGEDMLGMLVREHGDDLTRSELIGIASLLLIAGHETTANMLGLGTAALLQQPEQLAAIRDDPATVDAAVEELLRFLSVVHSGVPRLPPATPSSAVTTSRPASSSSCRCPSPIATPRWPRTPTCSTSPARSRRTSRSATACTTAWVRRWPARRWRSRSRRCSAGSRPSRSTSVPTTSRSGRPPSCTA